MAEELLKHVEAAIGRLADRGTGWVTRRDAAEALGRASGKAVEALRAHSQDKDVDVRLGVERALATASASLAGMSFRGPDRGEPLSTLARACEKPGEREVTQHGNGYAVRVKLNGDRHQVVYIDPHRRKDGVELVRVFSYCGAFSVEGMKWALQANMKLTQAALALVEAEGEERFVITNCFLATEVSPLAMKQSVKEIALYGDWMENKLTGLDEF